MFQNEVYLQEVADILCIAHAGLSATHLQLYIVVLFLVGVLSKKVLLWYIELPNLLSVANLAEALLRVENGAWLFCHVVANMPSCFVQGTLNLITLHTL